jgi:Mrp family chromosome partitioning ATPase
MELNRLKRILRDRWIVVVVVALLGALGAWAFTGFANQQRESRFEAETALVFQPQEGQTISDLTEIVDFNYELANFAAVDLLASDQNLAINLDPAGARIIFTAIANTEDEARANVEELLDTFFLVDPTLASVGVEDQLADVRAQALRIEEEITALEAEINPPATPEERAQMTFLDNQIQGMQNAIVELRVALVTAPEAERSDIASRLSRAEASLESLNEQRAAYPPTEPLPPTIEQQLELTSLESRLAVLQADFQRLFLRSLGVDDATRQEPISFENLTTGPGSGLVNAGIGFLGGMAVAVFGLIFINNSRKTIWMPEDVGVPLLADVPGRRVVSGVGPSWYDNTGGSPRKTAIQALRSGVEARLAGTAGAVAFAGNKVGSAAVHALVTDLAVSMASAGATVLLVDADLESDAALAEYHIGGPSLSAILKLSPDSLLLEREVGAIVDSAYVIRANLSVLPSGPPPSTPADALAGRQFRAFVQEASKRFDYVVVAVGEGSSTAAQVAMQRIGRSVLVLSPGRSTEPQVATLLADISARQVTTLGSIFVQRSEGPVQSRDSAVEVDSSIRRPEPQDGVGSPMNRLRQYPIPVEKHSGVLPSTSLRSLADRVSPTGVDNERDQVQVDDGGDPLDGDGLGSDLLRALSDTSPAEAYEAVADYLMTRVEDMMVAVPGQGDFSVGLTGDLHDNGFLPLRSVADHRSVGTWLAEELTREASGGTSDAIVKEMERILGFGSGVDSAGFDDWFATEFFSRHLRRTNGEPFVWHLTSQAGTAQLLAHATRFDRTSIEIVISDMARKLIDRLERDFKAASATGYIERSHAIEAQLADVRQFEISFGGLIGMHPDGPADDRRSRKDRAGTWNPDWNLGFRENLAPLQRAGLLPFPVLTDEEMDTFLAVV